MNSEIEFIINQLAASGVPKEFLDKMLEDFNKSQDPSSAQSLVDDILKKPGHEKK